MTISNKALTVTLTHATPHLKSLTIGNGTYATILSTTGWDTKIEADEVEVKAKATVTCSTYCTNDEQHRVWIEAGTLTVNGTISADQKGYYGNFNGPGWPVSGDNRHTGSYGGQGESPYWDGAGSFSKPYGSAEWPYDPGCGKGTNSGTNPKAGGGAIFLDVAGALVVNGTVTASAGGNGGSGGGIVINCQTIVGSGSVLANACSAISGTGGGGGGRVAVHYDTTAQANVMAGCLVRFEALGCVYSFAEPPTAASSCGSSQHHDEHISGAGTIWFTDWRMVTDSARAANGVLLGGVFTSSAATPAKISWPAGTTVEKCNLILDGVAIAVDGDLTVKATGGAGSYGGIVSGLEVRNSKGISVTGDLLLENSRLEFAGGTLTVGGSLEQKNSANQNQKRAGGALIVRATNTGTTFGAAVEVAGAWTIDKSCFVRPYAEPSTGEIPSFKANTFALAEGGLVDAREKGYGEGFGPAAASRGDHFGMGASHGGLGGYTDSANSHAYRDNAKRITYGDADHPVTPGSSGNGYAAKKCFYGGGVFHLEAARSAAIDGTIDADANYHQYASHYGSAAGGSIYVKTKRLSGNGTLQARGGTSHQGVASGWGLCAPGGGGRISLVASSYADGSTLTNNLSASAGYVCTNTAYFANAEAGTCRVSIGSVLTIAGAPYELGTVTPDYGTLPGLTGQTLDFALAGGVDEDAATYYHSTDGRRRGIFDAILFVTEDDTVTQRVTTTSCSRAIAEDTELYWAFRNVQSRLDVQSLNNGLVRIDGSAGVAETNLWLGAGDAVTLTAVPNEGLVFHRWEGDTDGLDALAAEITVDASVPRQLVAKYWDGEHEPITLTWNSAKATGNWDDGANWDKGVAPKFGDTVVIKTNASVTVSLSGKTAKISKLIIDNTAVNGRTTLMFTSWDSCLVADEVQVGERGTLSAKTYCTETASNRVWISCGTLTVAKGGRIEADQKGYSTISCGPGWNLIRAAGKSCHHNHGGSYGGHGFTSYFDNFDVYPLCFTYGSAEWPVDPGCGFSNAAKSLTLSGGGAIRIDALGEVTLNGEVTANANGKGSGGGVLIVCDRIVGTGAVRANGRNADSTEAAGGGGRVAVHYAPASQRAVTCGVTFEALGGAFTFTGIRTSMSGSYGASRNCDEGWSEPGTVWFPDWRFLTDADQVATGIRLGGVVTSAVPAPKTFTWPNGTVLEKSALVLSNCEVTVAGDLTVRSTDGAGARGGLTTGLVLADGASAHVQGDLTLASSRVEVDGGALTVDGDLLQTNLYKTASAYAGGGLVVRAAETNGTDGAAFGATVAVGGLWTLCDSAFVRLPTPIENGAIAGFTAGAFDLRAGALVDGYMTGFGHGKGPSPGAQSSSSGRGASHGGRGGYAGQSEPGKTYDSYEHPAMPGSSGSNYNGAKDMFFAFRGGSAFHLVVADAATVDGTINVDGSRNAYASHRTASAGGAVYLKAKSVAGTGTILARGGHSFTQETGSGWGVAGPGGGGRVAIVASSVGPAGADALRDNIDVSPGTVYNDSTNTGNAESGTVFFSIGAILTVAEEPALFGTVTPALGDTSGLQDASIDFALTGGETVDGTTWYLTADRRERALFDAALVVTDEGAVTQRIEAASFTRTVSEDTLAVWTFTNVQRRIAVSSLTNGKVSVDDGEATTVHDLWLDAEGVSVTLTAEPDEGLVFHRWEGDTNGIADVTAPEITLDGSMPRTLIAKYWDGEHEPKTTEWIGGGATTDWNDGANWSAGEAPGFGDTVIVNPAAATTVALTNATKFLSKVVIGNTGSDTATVLKFTGWETRLWADEIEVGARGTIAVGAYCTDTESNRVWIACGALTVAKGGTISANGKGYYTYNNGPAWTPGKSRHYSYTGSYGGRGNGSYWDSNLGGDYPLPHTYGSAEWPTDPGCGAGDNNGKRSGGGAIRIDANGAVTINGEITANGDQGCSGGSVLISCRTIFGSGAVRANSTGDNSGLCYGGGGRVAVHYDAAAQGEVACRVRFEALGGPYSVKETPTAAASYGSNVYQKDDWAEPGTLWFTDGQFVTDAARARAGVLLGGVVTSGADDLKSFTWPDGTTLEACLLVLSNSAATVQGDLTVKVTDATDTRGGYKKGLVVKDGSLRVTGDVLLENAKIEVDGSTLTVDGDLTQVNTAKNTPKRGGGALIARAAATDEAFGAFVTVGGTWTVGANTFVRPVAEPHEGAIPGFAAGSFVLAADGLVDAREAGYADGANGPGYGSQGDYQGRGGSHGGRGGYNAPGSTSITNCAQWTVYGSRRRPCEPGSTGSCYGNLRRKVFPGGGVFYLTAEKSAVLDGTIDADGSYLNYASHYTGSAGGSVFIQALRISGTGRITARGGSGNHRVEKGWCVPGCGGGGRIALRASTFDVGDLEAFKANNLSAAAGTIYDDSTDTGGAEDGTVWLGNHPNGTLLLVR